MPDALSDAQRRVAAMQTDPSISFWLKRAMKELLDRDPIDAANDAALLSEICNDHLREILDRHAPRAHNEGTPAGVIPLPR